MAGRQGSGGAKYAAISVVLLAIAECAMAATYTVGGSAEWNLNVDYNAWASLISFKVGDTLLFKYNAELHSVLQVSQANLKTCTTTGSLKAYQSGSDSVTLSDATTYYFICGTPNHCSNGMAVTIAVSGGSAATPAPTISPTPKVSPLPSPRKAVPSPAPASHSPSPSPIAPSPSKPSPSPSPSEAIPSPSPSETSPSPSSELSPSSAPTASSTPPPGSFTPPSPTSPQTSVPSPPSSSPSTVRSGTVVLLSAVLLGGFSLFF